MAESSIKMFGPLNFVESTNDTDDLNAEDRCLLCEDTFNLKLGFVIFLKHCFEVHRLVIEDVQNIENLREYLRHWREKFARNPVESVVPSIDIDSTGEKYFFLSSLLKEDENLRHRLKLETILNRQEYERTDTSYKKSCLFCRLQFEGLRSDYVKHLSVEHNLLLGNPQNLVHIDELIDRIERELDNCRCIFCEKTFVDRTALKGHMRKKIHKRINPSNKSYDKYFIVNYLEANKSWETIENEDDNISIQGEPNAEEEYSDWNEKEDQISCLFCAHRDVQMTDICGHMLDEHKFNFRLGTSAMDFYQKIKFVNYARRQVHNHRCVFCDEICNDSESLRNHMIDDNHYKIPPLKVFEQPEYYFPTYENDAFLYFLEEFED